MSKTLEAIITAPSLVREQWLPTELAVREVLAFERRFGSKHLMLACHAALPLILTPELLNLIHINFLDEEQIPWVAEVDFFLSPLCRPIDEALYEVEPSIREVLLVELENQYGFERPFELAKFLQFYLNHKSGSKQSSEITSTQRWIAKAYINPDRVVEELTDLLKLSLSSEQYLLNLAEIIKVILIIELIAEPLERTNLFNSYQYLINDSRILSHLMYGDIDPSKGRTKFKNTENKLETKKHLSLISPTVSKVLKNLEQEDIDKAIKSLVEFFNDELGDSKGRIKPENTENKIETEKEPSLISPPVSKSKVLKNLEKEDIDRAIKSLVEFFNGELISLTSVENGDYLLDPESAITNEVMVNDAYLLDPESEMTNEVIVNDDYSLYPSPELIDNEDAEDISCIRIRHKK
jgi:hypothetical protein